MMGSVNLAAQVGNAAASGDSCCVEPAGPLASLDLGSYIWLRGDLGLTGIGNGDPVPLWEDQSGYGNHMQQPTVGARPSFLSVAVGGKPGVKFTSGGGGDWLFTPQLFVPPSFSIWVVFKRDGDNPAVPGRLVDWNYPGNGISNAYITPQWGIGPTPNITGWVNDGIGGGTVQSFAQLINGGSTSLLLTTSGIQSNLYMADLDTPQPDSPKTCYRNATFGLCVGALLGGGQEVNATIAELALWPGVLSSAQRTALEAYQLARYGAL